MPSFSQNPNQGNAAINEPIQVWGRIYGGSAPYTTYTLDFGDGSAVETGPIDNTVPSRKRDTRWEPGHPGLYRCGPRVCHGGKQDRDADG